MGSRLIGEGRHFLCGRPPQILLLTASDENIDIRELKLHRFGVVEIPEVEVVITIFPLENNVLLTICNVNREARAHLYNLSNPNKPFLSIPFGKSVASASFDVKARLLAIQSDMEPGIIQFFKFGEDYKSRQNLKPVDLNKLFAVESCVEFSLQPNSKFFWFLLEGQVRKIDYKNGSMVNKALKLDKDLQNVKLKCTPDGSCLLAIDDSNITVPIMTETGTMLERVENISNEIQMVQISNQMIASQLKGGQLSFRRMVVTGAQHETKLNKEGKYSQKISDLHFNGKQLHWIDYIYWMFTKFPCNDLLTSDQETLHFWFTWPRFQEEFKSKLNSAVNSIWNRIYLTKKPMDFLLIHSAEPNSSVATIPDLKVTSVKLGNFLKQLITFVPIQIARCQSNSFYVLKDGQPISLESVQVAFDMVEKINLGFYESIISDWSKDIKVISSMGKQTTGKSYTLNHLSGSSFNIAGTRCTDGCWMTVKEQDDCLYVILDFEGLGSFERTEQDDMLLSLFNSSISTITIFKTEKRLDRDVDKMFNKINLGSDQLKGTDKVFKGKFMIVINDVAEQDVEDTPKEFEEKISNIVSSGENNFIKKLYNSDFEIMAFPAFESSEYYESIENLSLIIREELGAIFQSGTDFLATLKLLMAKLSINDFSPLDRQQIDERVQFLRSLLHVAISHGQISKDLPKKKELDLRSLDEPNFQILNEKSVELPLVGNYKLNDVNLVIESDEIEDFVLRFLKIKSLSSENFEEWRQGLERFVSESIRFRFERVQIWLEENLKKWRTTENTEYEDIINLVLENLDCLKVSHLQTLKLCDEKCIECFLKCTSILSHKGDHKCSTSHQCDAVCSFCDVSKQSKCKLQFGHDGKHVCKEESHVCSEPCRFQSLNKCTGECQKITGHQDEHQCSEKRHPCIEFCSLDGCEGRCVISCDEEHLVHKCTREECIQLCSVPSCSNKCAALDHFHGCDLSAIYIKEQQLGFEAAFLLDDGSGRFDCEEHFCGKEHQCQQQCDQDGYCHVQTEKQLDKDETFEGARDTFTYSVKYIEKGEKFACRKKLKLGNPPLQRCAMSFATHLVEDIFTSWSATVLNLTGVFTVPEMMVGGTRPPSIILIQRYQRMK